MDIFVDHPSNLRVFQVLVMMMAQLAGETIQTMFMLITCKLCLRCVCILIYLLEITDNVPFNFQTNGFFIAIF